MDRDRKRIQTNVAAKMEANLNATAQGAERLDRRFDVLDEALAKKETGDERKSDHGERALASSSPQGVRASPVAPNPDATMRNTMMSSPIPLVS